MIGGVAPTRFRDEILGTAAFGGLLPEISLQATCCSLVSRRKATL